MQEFRIVFPKQLTRSPYYMPSTALRDEISNLRWALTEFAARYGTYNEWQIELQGTIYSFGIEYIDSCWDDIPAFLTNCGKHSETEVDILLTDSPSYLIVVESRSVEELMVSIIDERSEPLFDFQHAPMDKSRLKRAIVNRQQFLQEWQSLVQSVIQILVAEKLVADDDESITEYLADVMSVNAPNADNP